MSMSRRELLKSLSAAAAGAPAARVLMLRLVTPEAAQQAHRAVSAEKAASLTGGYTPKFFSAHQYKTLRELCQTIIPADHESGGAVEGGAPEFLDLIASENQDIQLQLGGGIMWLDSECVERYGSNYVECSATHKDEILNLIAFRKNAEKDSRLGPGVEFFSALRKGVADGFFTSEIGIKYLGYIGNTYLTEFPGCPPVPEL
jgi:gluconate 2-dehydrogenase gamma chain